MKRFLGIAVTCAAVFGFFITVGGALAAYAQAGEVVVYDGPAELPVATEEDLAARNETDSDFSLMKSSDTQVRVNGEECFVYETNVNHSHSWDPGFLPLQSRTPVTYFDFDGSVTVEVTVPNQDLEQVSISPLAYGIEPEIDKEAHRVTFTISEPDTYTVQFHDSGERAVHIFANPIEEVTIDPNDENVIYVEPGLHRMDTILLKSNQTLYISGGAVVQGHISASGAENVKILGRGILDGSIYRGWSGRNKIIPIDVVACKNVEIGPILALNSNCWVCQGYETEDLHIDGLKIISSRPNGDGITLQSCRNVEVENVFVRSWDDSLVVKNYYRNSYNIAFHDTQIWTDLAQSMEIGYETNKGREKDSEISDISFKDITVLHNYHKPIISIHNADDADVHDIVYENITIEDSQVGSGDGRDMPYLIDLWITQNDLWSRTEERGTIHDITISNVKLLGGSYSGSRIKGYDSDHKITDVKIDHLEILGKSITDAGDGDFRIDENTTDAISFE